METITDNDLKMFQERARTEFASRCDTGGIAWDSVIWDLCNEVRRLRGVFKESGDAAKLRAALKSLMDNLQIHAMMPCEQITMNRAEVCAMIEDCRAALAAPPRNCDSYDSADEMMEKYADDAFLEEWKKWRETGKCHPLMLDAFLCINWLFLTNEKGETNGSK